MSRAAIVLAIAGGLLLVAGPVLGQTVEGAGDTPGSFVVLTGRIDIAEGETFQDAIILDGDVRIDGAVVGNVLAVNGDVTMAGSAGGSVAALNGRVTLEPGARVGGDLVSSEPADIAETATVGGKVSSQGLPSDFDLRRVTTVSRVAVWVATSLSSLALGLLLLLFAPSAGEAIAATASRRFGLSVGIGFAVFFGLPIGAVIVIVTLVGIPLGLGVLLALALLFWLGYVAAALALGRVVVKPPASKLLAFLAGWLALRLIAIVPGLGSLAWFLATVFGLGLLTVAARRAGRQPAGTFTYAGAAPPMPPPPPMPPA
ncbi:MAG: hypothetical protein H0W82_04570 [Actinobacteria bacterium]|nr:hypothetical protein [Actinomycetota bacterium]